jgi:hypothetical protein
VSELRYCLDQRRSRQRPLSGFAPLHGRLFDLPGLGVMPRQQLRLVLGDFRKPTLQSFGDAGMQRMARFTQQRAIRRILHQRMLEQIACVRRDALAE